MTIKKDTHLTLAGIPFKAETDNSLTFFAITDIREKNCRVSVPVYIFNFLQSFVLATNCTPISIERKGRCNTIV